MWLWDWLNDVHIGAWLMHISLGEYSMLQVLFHT